MSGWTGSVRAYTSLLIAHCSLLSVGGDKLPRLAVHLGAGGGGDEAGVRAERPAQRRGADGGAVALGRLGAQPTTQLLGGDEGQRVAPGVGGAAARIDRRPRAAQPFIDVQSVESLMLNSIGMQRFYLVVLTAFAAFAVLLAAVGVSRDPSVARRAPRGSNHLISPPPEPTPLGPARAPVHRRRPGRRGGR